MKHKLLELPAKPRFLIILMGSIGDVARGICLLPALKQKFPQSKISWLIEPKSEALLRIHPLVDDIIVFQRERGIAGIVSLAKTLRQSSFDVSLDLQRHFKSGLFARLAAAKHRIAFNSANSKELNWIFNNTFIGRQPEDFPKLSHYMKFLEPLGISAVDKLASGLENIDLSSYWPSALENTTKNYILIVVGSSWESKDWPLNGYKQLIERLVNQYKKTILLIGDRSQETRADQLLKTFQSDQVINLVGKTSLPQVAALIKNSLLMIGPDSGPAHIAGALSKPHITLFGPTSPARTVALGSGGLVVKSSIGCSPCYRRKCPGLDKICMRLISADAVLEKAAGYLN